ncbi:unnamed protein product [Lepeophtheirus salmonis]|uniref:(salmon louse) hypothetical protein n=1 Tax=Lepeophtheirus salmonis TaxID=72036 RepID=A0A7R8CCR8_LEPSM|nr:unnamed protein product [Lepeophtheirus salmonis]CAF2772146.1 unnamed protein product [Lepeophtheirus salmonis]
MIALEYEKSLNASLASMGISDNIILKKRSNITDRSNQNSSERVQESLVYGPVSWAEEMKFFCDSTPNGVCVPKEGLTSNKDRIENENDMIESEEDCVLVDQRSSDAGVEKGGEEANRKKPDSFI